MENMLVVLDQLNQISSQIIDTELLFPELAFYKLNDLLLYEILLFGTD